MRLRGWLSLLRGTGRGEWRGGQARSIGDIERVEIAALNIRLLQRGEVPLIWQIDRREVVENIYYLHNGKLILKPDYFDIQGWPPGEAEHYTPLLLDCYDRGGSVVMTERGNKRCSNIENYHNVTKLLTFASFLCKDCAIFTSDEYQVLPHAADSQTVIVSYGNLTSLIDPQDPLTAILR